MHAARRRHPSAPGGMDQIFNDLPARHHPGTRASRHRADEGFAGGEGMDDIAHIGREMPALDPRPGDDSRQTGRAPVDEPAPREIVDERLDHQLLRAVTHRRQRQCLVVDALGQRHAEYADAARENEFRRATLPRKPFEQSPARFEIDPPAQFVVARRGAARNGGEVEYAIEWRCEQFRLQRRIGQAAEARNHARVLEIRKREIDRLDAFDGRVAKGRQSRPQQSADQRRPDKSPGAVTAMRTLSSPPATDCARRSERLNWSSD